jgi:glycosyltransferase involved in cell wall biosynthesis
LHPSASVIVPAYNGASFLTDTLTSVFAQTVRPGEVLVVDDCSTDGTVEVVERMAREAPVPVRLLRMPHNSGGPTRPMNCGVEQASGEIIVPLDQDDRMTPRRIELLTSLLAEHPDAPLAFGLSYDTDLDGVPESVPNIRVERVYEIEHRALADGSLLLDGRSTYAKVIAEGNFLIGASNIAFRKSAWQAVGGFREDLPQVWDYDFLCKVVRRGPIGFVPQVINLVRRYAGSLSARLESSILARLQLTAEHLRQPLWPLLDEALRSTRRRMKDEYLGLAYYAAKKGEVLLALRCYWQAFRLNPRSFAPLWYACKLPAHCLHARLGGSPSHS